MSNRDIIVIGGSAGATAPLKQILGRLPPDLPAAVFIVLHIPAQGIGILSMVASSAEPLPVRQAENGMKIEPGQVYLTAPDHHLLLSQDHVFLGRGPRENMVRPAIDPLFRSAAISYGPRVIGVLLSGLLSDGAAGLSAIKRCGGISVVQDPSDAIADEMPRSALEATIIDLCVPGAGMGDVLSDLAREVAGAALPIGTSSVGATTDRATLAPTVLTKPRRVRRCTLGVRELEFVTRNSFPRRHYVWRRPRYLARSGSAQE